MKSLFSENQNYTFQGNLGEIERSKNLKRRPNNKQEKIK